MTTQNSLLMAGALALAVLSTATANAQSSKAAAAPDAAPPTDTSVPVTWDNQIWYRMQPYSHDPFNNKDNGKAKAVNKQMLHYEHTDTGGIVWNSFTITALFADRAEDSGRITDELPGTAGSRELYSTYRGDISLTGFGRPPISFPGVADVQLEFGGDVNWKDDVYQARRKFLLIGPAFVLDAPGSLTFAVHYAKEFNHNGIIGRDVQFHPTWNTELSYTQYFDDAHLFRLEGVFNMTGQKGKDYVPFPVKTATEFYTYNTFILDVGQLLKLPPHKLDLFAGVQYWVNKFGYPKKNDAGALEFTPYAGIGVHF